jgi:hypothetical protein
MATIDSREPALAPWYEHLGWLVERGCVGGGGGGVADVDAGCRDELALTDQPL